MKITCKLFHLNVRTNLRNGGSTRSWKRSIHADEKKMSLPMVQPGERAESFDQPRRPWLGVCVCVCVRWVYDGWVWFISDGRIIMMPAIIARHPSLFRRGEAMSFPRWQPVRVVRRASEGFVCGVKLSAYRGPASGQLRWNELAAWQWASEAWWWTVLSTGKQENGKYFLRLSCRFAGLLLLAGAFLFGCNLAVMGKGNQFYYTAKQRRCKFQARG